MRDEFHLACGFRVITWVGHWSHMPLSSDWDSLSIKLLRALRIPHPTSWKPPVPFWANNPPTCLSFCVESRWPRNAVRSCWNRNKQLSGLGWQPLERGRILLTSLERHCTHQGHLLCKFYHQRSSRSAVVPVLGLVDTSKYSHDPHSENILE